MRVKFPLKIVDRVALPNFQSVWIPCWLLFVKSWPASRPTNLHTLQSFRKANPPEKGDFLGPSQIGTPASTEGLDNTTRCSPGKDAENKLSQKWRRMPVTLTSNFDTSLGKELPDSPWSICSWSMKRSVLYSWMWMVTTPEDFKRNVPSDYSV